MQCILYRDGEGAHAQQLAQSWHGHPVEPPFHFRFTLTGRDTLRFEAWREAAAHVHPAAAPGVFQEELWRYDVVEFFIATADARRYLEFNLCPNGAWWAAGFTDPRVPLPGFNAQELQPAIKAEMLPTRWRCSVEVPLAALRPRGWEPATARMAAAAVLCRGGQYTYLTTCDQRSGKPDFHHPQDWEESTNTPDGCKGGWTCGASHAPRRGEPQMGLGRINDEQEIWQATPEGDVKLCRACRRNRAVGH